MRVTYSFVGPDQVWYSTAQDFFKRSVKKANHLKRTQMFDRLLEQIDENRFESTRDKHIAYWKADHIANYIIYNSRL